MATIRTEADMEKYKGKLSGKIVMTSEPRELPFPTTADGLRVTTTRNWLNWRRRLSRAAASVACGAPIATTRGRSRADVARGAHEIAGKDLRSS